MELRNIGLNYKGKEITLITELHITAAAKGERQVQVIYVEPGDTELRELNGYVRDFRIFDKSENK